jgi:pimeloyl-ACP methyl ester carboxylesterase
MLEKIKQMWLTGPTMTVADLARIAAPTLVLVGDADVPTWKHTLALYRALPDSQLCVVPGAGHTVLLNKPALVNEIILTFLASPTRVPESI